MSRTAALLLSLATLGAMLGGCASETLPEPEPEVDTPGAFIAQREGTGELSLLRMLDQLTVEGGDTLFFVSVYADTPKSWDDARELAKRHDLRLREVLVTALAEPFLASDYRVVWFRTLTDEEIARVRP